MGSAGGTKTRWQKIARRVRVPLGFVMAAVFGVFARPSWTTLAWSLLLVLPGLWLRGYAAGYVKKNAELTRTGPYAYTRNPLYLGSMLLAAGFAVAAGALSTERWWLGVLLVAMFLAAALDHHGLANLGYLAYGLAVLLLCVVTYIFFERDMDSTTRRLARDVAADVDEHHRRRLKPGKAGRSGGAPGAQEHGSRR